MLHANCEQAALAISTEWTVGSASLITTVHESTLGQIVLDAKAEALACDVTSLDIDIEPRKPSLHSQAFIAAPTRNPCALEFNTF